MEENQSTEYTGKCSEELDKLMEQVYGDKAYCFTKNSGLIDVNSRFRIFKFYDKTYISKKTDRLIGKREVRNAESADSRLSGTKVEKFEIQVVIPKIVKTTSKVYLISPYKGESLQECYYGKSKNNLTSDLLIKILNIFIEKGIYYRDFLPRNTIVNIEEKKIFLIDWENVGFYTKDDTNLWDISWETNFLLNWGYLFPVSELKKLIYKKLRLNSNNDKSPLITYEKTFKEILNINYSDFYIKKLVSTIVLEAEKKNNSFSTGLKPLDIAHMISDVFGNKVDVLFDMICYESRKNNIEIYNLFLEKLNNIFYNLESFKTPKKVIVTVLNEMLTYLIINFLTHSELKDSKIKKVYLEDMFNLTEKQKFRKLTNIFLVIFKEDINVH